VLTDMGPVFGLHVAPLKCEMYCNHEDEWTLRQMFPTFLVDSVMGRIGRFDEVSMLGSAIGSQPFVDDHLEAVADLARRKFEAIAQMPHIHAASTTLAFCGGGVLNHLCRTATPRLDLLEAFDSSYVATAAAIYGVPPTERVAQQLSLPKRRGGFGFRKSAEFARIAFLASAIETRGIQSTVCGILQDVDAERNVQSRVLEELPLTSATNALSTLREDILQYVGDPERSGRRLQHLWSSRLSAVTHESILSALAPDVLSRARLNSCAGSSNFIHPTTGICQRSPWLSNPQITTVTRLRLGLPLSSDHACRMCRAHAAADSYGAHSLVCMGGGYRTLLHHAMVREISTLASAALVNPRREICCFPNAPQRRCDVLLHGGGPRAICVDYACVHPLTDAAARVASATIGGAATAYERHKVAEYGQLAEAANLDFVPFVQDTFGCLGRSAIPLLETLIRKKADRFGLPRAVAFQQERQHLSVQFTRLLANLLLVNSAELVGE